MLPGLSIEFDDDDFNKKFAGTRIEKAMKRAMKVVGIDIQSRIREGFNVGGWDPKSGKAGAWPKRKIPKGVDEKTKLKKRSAKAKTGAQARIRVGGKTLYDTGRLHDSITASPVRKTGKGLEVFVGTNVPYAKVHQFGATQKATKKQAALLRSLGFSVKEGSTITTPKREIFVMPKKWQRETVDLFRDEFIADFEKA